MDKEALRIMDANGNRAREALRVMEEYARFVLEDAALMGELKEMRHGLAGAIEPFALGIVARDTPGDVGTAVKTEAEFVRGSLGDVALANGKRLSEALRVMEEVAKTQRPETARELERLRYRAYEAEKRLTLARLGSEARVRFEAVRVYVLLTQSVCVAGRSWEATLDEILAANLGPALCVQLREKGLADGELLRRAKMVAGRCHAAGALFVINDRADVAMLSGADGVHVGQEDLPCDAVRKCVGPSMIVGVSTERLEQARAAVGGGASYVACGPMFATATKVKPRIAGPGYAAEVVRELGGRVPVVAIGGIGLENVGEVAAAGVRCVAVSSCVLRAQRPAEAVRGLAAAMGDF